MDAVTSVAAYEAPTVALSKARLQMAYIIYIVAIVLILVLGAVALFCIAKGKNLLWAQKGWLNWKIACE